MQSDSIFKRPTQYLPKKDFDDNNFFTTGTEVMLKVSVLFFFIAKDPQLKQFCIKVSI